MNKKMVKIIFFIYLGVLILAFLAVLIIAVIKIITPTSKTSNLGQIEANTTTSEVYVPAIDDQWIKADQDYEESHGFTVAIVDNNSILSQKDFLSTQAHFTINEEITNYLYLHGYTNCKYVIVNPESASQNGSVSSFSMTLEEYPDTILYVEAYNLTHEFEFSITVKE